MQPEEKQQNQRAEINCMLVRIEKHQNFRFSKLKLMCSSDIDINVALAQVERTYKYNCKNLHCVLYLLLCMMFSSDERSILHTFCF